jgi:hypothetical protein
MDNSLQSSLPDASSSVEISVSLTNLGKSTARNFHYSISSQEYLEFN